MLSPAVELMCLPQRVNVKIERAGNTMFARGEGSGTISFLSNQDINIYPESSTFISDQAIYQWKEKKNGNLDKITKDSEKHLIHP